MKITEGIYYVGVNDHEVTVFEGQYHVPNGMAYNSYVILDEKIAVMDTVDEAFGQQWVANVDGVLQGRKPDYLVVQHMEPDHSANILLFLEKYPEAEIVATPQAFKMMNQFYSLDSAVKQVPAANGGEPLCHCEGGGHPFHRPPRFCLCGGPHGALARGYDDIRIYG